LKAHEKLRIELISKTKEVSLGVRDSQTNIERERKTEASTQTPAR
jgi:hypothetical protein